MDRILCIVLNKLGTFQNLKSENCTNCNQSLYISDNNNSFVIPSKHYKFEEHPNWLFRFDRALSIPRQESVNQLSVSLCVVGNNQQGYI